MKASGAWRLRRSKTVQSGLISNANCGQRHYAITSTRSIQATRRSFLYLTNSWNASSQLKQKGSCTMKHHLSVFILLSLSLLLLGSSLAAPRHASAATVHVQIATSPSCSGEGCNGSDPYATRCAGNGTSYRVVDSVPVVNIFFDKVGYVQLWYSDTCGTNWSRFLCTVSTSHCPFINDLELNEESSPGCQCGTGIQFVRDTSSTDVRTAQQYLPHTRAEASLMVDCSNEGCGGGSTHWE
jgi:uncharacterized protein DUF2690